MVAIICILWTWTDGESNLIVEDLTLEAYNGGLLFMIRAVYSSSLVKPHPYMTIKTIGRGGWTPPLVGPTHTKHECVFVVP